MSSPTSGDSRPMCILCIDQKVENPERGFLPVRDHEQNKLIFICGRHWMKLRVQKAYFTPSKP